jgi:hypothetical protein
MSGIKLFGDWNQLQNQLDPVKFAERLHRHVHRANSRIGYQFEARAVRAIRAKKYAPNSPMTVILKGSSTPLFDRGDLSQQITYEQPSWGVVRVGVVRAKAGSKAVNIARILHEGATIDVGANPKVRMKVWAMIRERLGDLGSLNSKQRKSVKSAAGKLGASGKKAGGRPLTKKQLAYLHAKNSDGASSPAPKIWVIPPRPFIVEPLNDAAFITYTRGQWSDAVRLALFGK